MTGAILHTASIHKQGNRMFKTVWFGAPLVSGKASSIHTREGKIVYKTNDLENDLPTQEFRVNLDHTPEYPKTFISLCSKISYSSPAKAEHRLIIRVDLICTP